MKSGEENVALDALYGEWLDNDINDWHSLSRLLESGEIDTPNDFHAYGIKDGEKTPSEIPASAWEKLRLVPDKNASALSAAANDGSATYRCVTLMQADIQRWKTWRAELYAGINPERHIGKENVTLQRACTLLATGREWSPVEFTAFEERENRYKNYHNLLDNVLNKTGSTVDQQRAQEDWEYPLENFAKRLRLEAHMRGMTHQAFLAFINGWLRERDALRDRLFDAAEKIYAWGVNGQLTLSGISAENSANSRCDIEGRQLQVAGLRLCWQSKTLSDDDRKPVFTDICLARKQLIQLIVPTGQNAKTEDNSKGLLTGALSEQLAEWIFTNRSSDSTKHKLLAAARRSNSGLPAFTEVNFNDAYQRVFITRVGKPPASGWTLQPEYANRL